MKKLHIVGINARYTHSNLAIRYLRNSIQDLDLETDILEFSINQPDLNILEKIVKERPDIIAVSVYIWNTQKIISLISELKKILPQTKLILGGPEVSYNAEEWLKNYPQIDFVIGGSGEAGFRYLLENDCTINENILVRKNPHFSKIPFPYLETDFPKLLDKYLYYESSRGCSFNCSYCLSSRLDQKQEFRDLILVKKELEFLIARKPRIIKFVDRTFNIKKEHSRAIWEFLIDLNPSTKFHFEIHPELLEDEDFEILQSCPADLFQFEIGIQSTNPPTLESIHRRSSWSKISVSIRKLINLNNINIHVDLIAGLPFEGLKQFKKSFNDIYSLGADNMQLGFLKILPGTELAEQTYDFRMIATSQNPYLILQNNWLSFQDLIKLHQIEKLLNTFKNSHNFDTLISHLIPLHGSAYDLYWEFASYLTSKKYDLNTKNWQKNAFELLNFANSKFSDKMDFFKDCLKWDWCKQAKSHYYPQFLRSKQDLKAKKKGYVALQLLKKQGNIELSSNEIKRIIYFIPLSPEFKKIYSLQAQIVIFVKGNPIFL
ncbi:MAG: B12-binding domain-containing radical SAM protein [Candidatus Cloacimonetes bacterium]|nr:B12-binding domain-containing radical SAM protein [Candidatus Cloacimonadota bacterium]